jgi:hypothetical protein
MPYHNALEYNDFPEPTKPLSGCYVECFSDVCTRFILIRGEVDGEKYVFFPPRPQFHRSETSDVDYNFGYPPGNWILGNTDAEVIFTAEQEKRLYAGYSFADLVREVHSEINNRGLKKCKEIKVRLEKALSMVDSMIETGKSSPPERVVKDVQQTLGYPFDNPSPRG